MRNQPRRKWLRARKRDPRARGPLRGGSRTGGRGASPPRARDGELTFDTCPLSFELFWKGTLDQATTPVHHDNAKLDAPSTEGHALRNADELVNRVRRVERWRRFR